MKNVPEKVGKNDLPPELRSFRLGLWRVAIERDTPIKFDIPWINFSPGQLWTQCRDFVRETHVTTLFWDVYNLGPALFFIVVLSNTLNGVESAISLYLSNNLLNLIEKAIASGSPDKSAILSAVVYRVLFLTLVSVWRWFASRNEPLLKSRVKMYFQERLMQSHLSMDYEAAQDNSNNHEVTAMSAWYALHNLLDLVDVIFSTISQMIFVSALLWRHGDGAVIVVLCLGWPIINRLLKHELAYRDFIAWIDNRAYLRASALYDLATDRSRKREVVSGRLEEYIYREHIKARGTLSGTCDDYPTSISERRQTPWANVSLDLMNEFPIIYYAINCILQRGTLSIASLSTLQQTSDTLQGTIERILREKENVKEELNNIKAVYCGMEAEKSAASEASDDEASDELEKTLQSAQGMEIELRDVTFKYPGSDTPQPAVRNVSFKLAPGSLVVIVGSNGSGKSSLVNLLAGLYAPTSGTILYNGIPSSRKRARQIQNSTALLTQDHTLFPGLSVGENIGMGDPDNVNDMDRVREAARMGGALEFIENKCPEGFDEILGHICTLYSSYWPVPELFKGLYDKIEVSRNVSGGEEQRLAAARTFMRLTSPRTKLVIADEPTSAMDPLGEYTLFEQLRALREGKTMIFITHRFGHLTKYADMILCMKDGELIESGTHVELMTRRGEYCNLYEIQAKAFTEAPSPGSDTDVEDTSARASEKWDE